MRRRLLLATLALAAACRHDGGGRTAADDAPDPSRGCRRGTLAASTGDRGDVPDGDGRRAYVLDAPGGPADVPLPVVLVFHGFRGDAAGLRAVAGWPALAARDGFIVVHPDGHEGVRLLGTEGRGWDLAAGETRDAAVVRALLDRLESERCVDRRREFATGFSNGGFFANLLGCTLPTRLAAVAAVSGARALPGCAPERPMPILFIQGRADDVVDPSMVRAARDWWAGVDRCTGTESRDGCDVGRGCEADVVFCAHAGAHVWPPDATGRIWQFFRDHPRPPG
jgi:polyhydroxybutyrate depolymerase